jgi:hypothetical protein
VTETQTESDADVRRRRSLNTTSRDMVLSMAVIVGLVLAFLLLVPRPNQIPARTLDVAAAAQRSASDLGFRPSVPSGLPAGWTARAADVQRATDQLATWHLSYTTPSGGWAGVQQTAKATKDWEARQVTNGKEQGSRQLGRHSWIIRSRPDRGIISLVLRQPPITTVVTGTATPAELDQFAAAAIP